MIFPTSFHRGKVLIPLQRLSCRSVIPTHGIFLNTRANSAFEQYTFVDPENILKTSSMASLSLSARLMVQSQYQRSDWTITRRPHKHNYSKPLKACVEQVQSTPQKFDNLFRVPTPKKKCSHILNFRVPERLSLSLIRYSSLQS